MEAVADELNTVKLSKVPLKKVKCASCARYLNNPPVYIRITGDSICANCCVTSGFAPIRNKIYEEIMKGSLFPCQFATRGCPIRVGFNNTAMHETNCKYQNYQCPVDTCSWQGRLDLIVAHIIDNHVVLKAECMKFIFSRGSEVFRLLHIKERTFLLCIGGRRDKISIKILNLDTAKPVEYKLSIYKPNAKEEGEIRKKAKSVHLNCSQSAVEFDSKLIEGFLGPSDLLECSVFLLMQSEKTE